MNNLGTSVVRAEKIYTITVKAFQFINFPGAQVNFNADVKLCDPGTCDTKILNCDARALPQGPARRVRRSGKYVELPAPQRSTNAVAIL